MNNKKNILLIDDDINLLNSISAYLVSEGFQINMITSGYKALINLNNIKPDLIITDIMMPDINGYDLIKQIRSNENYCQLPIIFLTAKGMTDDRILGYNLGCNAYLAKPFCPQELISIINNIFKNLAFLTKNINTNINQKKNKNSIFNSFTKKENLILVLVSKGYTNKEIASILKSSIRNVEKYVSILLKKTNTRNRTELTKLAILNDLHR
uniref:TctD-like protein n=1 Tax=Hydropuntia rangiferina TaxID=338881 RepID=A0A345U8M4_9FLOR|nr:hypothetical protein [Hydropuntia rangiferina]AXI96810.1 hypothetical protein [Hydropuntia rangiferina]UAD87490.1 hypothetical protein [Hydropuntia rangiferina]